MYQFSKISNERLSTTHKDLQIIMNKALEVIDISILEGARSDETQIKYFKEGKSKLDGITQKSKHQITKQQPLSHAVDIAPYPIDFSNKQKSLARFYYTAGIIKAIAHDLHKKGIISHSIRWGGDWNSNNIFTDQTFDDLVHFELKA